MNRLKTGLSLAVLVLLWVGNIFYFQRYQLDELLFMKHYYNFQNIGNEMSFDLYYLVNHSENVRVSRVHIPALGIDSSPAWDNERSRLQYQQVRNVRLEWNESTMASLDDHTKVTEIEVEFTNGTRQFVDIGEIAIRRVEPDQPYIHSHSSGSSSDHTGFSIFREKELLKPIRVRHLPSNLDPKVLSIQVDGQDINGEHPDGFDHKSFLEVKYAFQFPKHDRRAQHVYGSMPVLEVQTEGGKIKEALMFLHYIPHWNNEDIKAILNERRDK